MDVDQIPIPEWFEPYESSSHDSASYRRNLPHWRQVGATYFVTLRLNDSLPKDVVVALRAEREWWQRRIATERTNGVISDGTLAEWAQVQRRHFKKVEAIMDAGYGSCLLREPRYRACVAEALGHFEGKRCRMAAFVVMPNHVHALVQPLLGHTVEKLTGSWKSFTAFAINGLLGRSGQLWQRETFDRIVRNDAEFQRTVDYIIRNATKLPKRSAEVWLCDALHSASVA